MQFSAKKLSVLGLAIVLDRLVRFRLLQVCTPQTRILPSQIRSNHTMGEH